MTFAGLAACSTLRRDRLLWKGGHASDITSLVWRSFWLQLGSYTVLLRAWRTHGQLPRPPRGGPSQGTFTQGGYCRPQRAFARKRHQTKAQCATMLMVTKAPYAPRAGTLRAWAVVHRHPLPALTAGALQRLQMGRLLLLHEARHQALRKDTT